ncbi:hypothetical protein Dimus_001334 [Dionaea muscipula]
MVAFWPASYDGLDVALAKASPGERPQVSCVPAIASCLLQQDLDHYDFIYRGSCFCNNSEH